MRPCRVSGAAGTAADRLVFAPRLHDAADHMARYRVADLALDTFPYTSHTTANDALWLGCPVVTLVGVFRNTSGQPIGGATGPDVLSSREKDRWTRCRNLYWDLTSYRTGLEAALPSYASTPSLSRAAPPTPRVAPIVTGSRPASISRRKSSLATPHMDHSRPRSSAAPKPRCPHAHRSIHVRRPARPRPPSDRTPDRKSTRLNSSHRT